MANFGWLHKECSSSCKRYFTQAMIDPRNLFHLPNSGQLFGDSSPCTALDKHCQLLSLSSFLLMLQASHPSFCSIFLQTESNEAFLFCLPSANPVQTCFPVATSSSKFIGVLVVSKLFSHTHI